MTKAKHKAVRDDYLELIREFPLRELRDEVEHEVAIAVVTRLMMKPRLTAGERDYAGALSALVEGFEKKRWLRPSDMRAPHEKLSDLMDESGMSQSELADLLGVKQPMASLLMRGKRELTPAYILKLAERFALRAEYFMC